MEDDLIASLDIIEPPRKKFKRLVHQDQPPQSQTRRVSKSLYHPCFIKNIPREILSEILDYLDTTTIYHLTITCHYFKECNLWGSITKLDIYSHFPLFRVMDSVDVAKLTKLESFDIDRADRLGYLSALPRFTNLLSLNTKGGHLHTSLLANLLPHFPLLRELTTPLKPIVLVNYQGAYLTKLNASHCHYFDARFIVHFRKLQVLDLSMISCMTNADTLTHLTCLTALTVIGLDVAESEVEALCRLTRLQYFEVRVAQSPPMDSLSKLCNLTTLKTTYYSRNWTKILEPLTALQRVEIMMLVTRSFTPQHCSTITRLAYYRSATPAPTDQSHVFELIALQSLDIDISSDPAMHSKFTKLQRLTSLTLRLDKFVKVDLQSLFWTSLRSLSRLELPRSIDPQLVNETKQLMPSVHIVVPQ
jgi:hypothetical protein